VKAGWKEATLGTVTAKGETVDPTRQPDATFTYVDVSSVSNETFEIVQTSEVLGASAPSRARRLIRTNDVIFATIRPTLKRIAVVPQSLNEQVCSTGYIVLRALPGLHPRFLYYFLFTDDFQEAMESLQTGASYPAVTDGQVRQQPFPLPPLEEQHRIVAVLDEAFEGLTRARAHAEANLRDARELVDSAMEAEEPEDAGAEPDKLIF
jgi:type I restriction enzyme S subunit